MEDQLLNQGTSTAPGTAWACSDQFTPESLLFGYYGQADGLFGVISAINEVSFVSASYSIDSAGTTTFTILTADGTVLISLAAPAFVSGTQFFTILSVPGAQDAPVTCDLVSINLGGQEPTPPVADGNLQAQLLNRGTQTVPQGAWDCGELAFGFYASGQALFGLPPQFFQVQYRVEGENVILSAPGVNDASLTNIAFSGPNDFSGVFNDGVSITEVQCTRTTLTLANSQFAFSQFEDSQESALSALKNLAFDKQPTVFSVTQQ